jgi:hypothetical protein
MQKENLPRPESFREGKMFRPGAIAGAAGGLTIKGQMIDSHYLNFNLPLLEESYLFRRKCRSEFCLLRIHLTFLLRIGGPGGTQYFLNKMQKEDFAPSRKLSGGQNI